MKLNQQRSDPRSDVAGEQRVRTFTADQAEARLRAAQKVIERKWHPLVVYHLLDNGPLSFSTLQNRLGGISNKMLSETLKDLTEKDIVNREVVNDVPIRVKYSLSGEGKALQPVIESMIDWGLDSHLAERDVSKTSGRS